MKRLLFGVGALLASGTQSLAGDLPLQRQPTYVPPEVVKSLFNWTGFYVGAHVGYGWGSAIGGNADGFLGGLQGGYNIQVSPSVVLGVESDITFTSMDANVGAAKFSVDYLGTMRARLGYSVDRVMFYATGGLAYGRGDLEIGGLSNKEWHWGWTMGGGVEAMLSSNVSAKLEYLYVNLNDETYQSILGARSVGYNTNLLRGGINYRF